MKKLLFLLIGLMAFALAACSDAKDNDKSAGDELPKMVEVSILLPEKIDPNVETEIKAHVTQDGKNVEDANEVKFEVFKNGDKEHEMIEAKHAGDGIYTIKKTFAEAGHYVVISHVTARDMHNMPKKEFVVGNPSEESADGHDHHESGDGHGSAEGHDHGHGHGSVAIDFPVTSAAAGEETLLKADIQHEDKPLTGARVTFEVWKEGVKKHEFLPAKETAGGSYELKHAFPSAGDWTVNVHVEKGDDLHEHQEKIVTVK
ncbi:FixH family protein [Bacillus sp. FJAT-27245]|uniref:FixH family protein n=1 Tax=Bacillus sp. FJAT-27245 TaxID=1684144 RepID=UPI0006A79618|nr:FixH family protein [Bacillus sp. FJAT-27245]